MSAVPIRCAGGTPTMSGSYNKRPPLFPVAAATSATNGHKGVQYPSSSDSAASADPNVIYVYLKPNEEKPSVGHGHRQRLRDMRDSEEQVVMAPARKSSEAPRNTHDSAEHMAKELSFAPMMATSQERTPAAAERQNYAQQRQVQEPPPIMAPEEVLLANGASSRATPRLLTPSCQAMSPMRHDATPERMTQRSASRDVPVDDLRSTSGARQYGENQVYNSAQTFQTAQALPMHESQGVISRTPEPRAISPRKTPTPALQESNHDLFNSAQTDSLPRPYSEPTGNSQLLEPSVRGSRILSPLKQSVSTSRAPPKINTPNNDLWVSAQSSASPVFANLHTDSRATPVPAHIRDDVPLMSSYRESREQPPPPPPRLSPIAQNLREESLIMPSHRESRKTSQVGGRSTYRESDVQRSAHRNSERSLMMKAPVSRSSNAEISAIQETNVDLIMMGQQYSTDHLPQELFLNDERVVLWNSEDSLVLSPFSKSQHVSHLLHERVAMWNPLKNSFELSPSSGDEVKPPMKRKATVPQTELRSSMEPPRDARITPAQYASMRSRDDLPELYRSMANAPLIQTRHSTEFPGTEWGPILNDQPDALYEAFCGDVCEACEIHNDAVTDLSFSLGSLHVTYTVCHYATVPSADIKHRLNEFLFPRTNALYEHRSYSPNTRSSMGTGTQRQHDDQPRGSLVVARSEPMSNTESAVRSINAQMHERNAAGESGGRSTFLFPGTSAPLDHEYQSSRQMETEAIQERSHRGSVHTQPDTSRSAEAMPLASTVLVHGSAEVKPPGDAKDMNMSALSFARRESMKTVEVPEDRSKQPSVMEMQSRADGNYDTTRELHRNLDDSAKTPSTTEQQAQHASFAALPGRSEGNLQSTRELRNAMAATPTPEDGSTNYATKGMILPDDLYKVFAGLSTLHNPPTLSLAYPFNAVLHNLHSPLDMYHYSCRRFHVEPNMHAEDAFREWNVDKRHLTGRNSMEDPCNLSVVSHLNVAEMDLFTVGVLPILDVLRWCPSVEMLNFSNNQCTNATLEWLTFLIMGMDTVKYVRDSLRQSVKMVEENTMSDQQHLGSAAPRGLSDEVAEYLKNHEDDIVGRYGTPFSNLRVICADDNKFTHMAYRLGENLLRARPLLQKVELRGVALLPINGRVPKKNSRIFV